MIVENLMIWKSDENDKKKTSRMIPKMTSKSNLINLRHFFSLNFDQVETFHSSTLN